MVKYHIRTIKLKIFVVGEDKDANWKRLRQIFGDGWRAANLIASGQYFNDQLVRNIYSRRKIDPKEDKQAVKQIEEEFKGFFGTKRQATTERDIKKAYPKLPSCVTNPLNQVVVSSYNKEKRELLTGIRSLRTYRKDMPVVTTKQSVKFSKNEDNHHNVTWTLGRNESIKLGIIYGKDRANNRLTVGEIIEGKLDYSAPQFQYKNRDLFLLLPIKDPQQELELNPELSVGVDLGLTFPAYVALSEGPARRPIGHIDDFLRVRIQMQKRRQHLQKSLKSTHGGKGRQKKMKALNRIRDKERNFARSHNHYISQEIVGFTLKNRAGVIKMELLEGFGQKEIQAFVLRNWSYFELQTMIEYKAKRAGIAVVKIDPYHTSQACSACGNDEEGQRDKQKFECIKCGEKLNADHNAALNIARSDKQVTKKEECEFYKQQQLNKNKVKQ